MHNWCRSHCIMTSPSIASRSVDFEKEERIIPMQMLGKSAFTRNVSIEIYDPNDDYIGEAYPSCVRYA